MTKSIKAYKAFNADWTCKGLQYEIGKTYQHQGDVSLCNSGYHACEVPFDCWNYYAESMTFAAVDLNDASDQTEQDSKRVTASITICAQLTLPEWIKAQAAVVVGLCKMAVDALVSGKNECAAATGNRGHAAATGDWGHAAATGENSIAVSIGINGVAQGAIGSWIVCSYYDQYNYKLLSVKSAKVDGDKIKPNTPYMLAESGEFIEVTGNE